jgi:hypothetical protein
MMPPADTPVNPAPSPEQILLAHDEQLKIQAGMLASMDKNLNDVMEYLKKLPGPTVNPAPAPAPDPPMPNKVGGTREISSTNPKRAVPKPVPPPNFMGRADPNGYEVWSFKVEKYLNLFPDLDEEEQANTAAGYLKGPALTWLMHHEKHVGKFNSLAEFLKALAITCNLKEDSNKAEDIFYAVKKNF